MIYDIYINSTGSEYAAMLATVALTASLLALILGLVNYIGTLRIGPGTATYASPLYGCTANETAGRLHITGVMVKAPGINLGIDMHNYEGWEIRVRWSYGQPGPSTWFVRNVLTHQVVELWLAHGGNMTFVQFLDSIGVFNEFHTEE